MILLPHGSCMVWRRLSLWLALIGFFALSSGLTRAQGVVRWTTNFYSVTGATIPELRQSIRENRPWKQRVGHDAMTDWLVNWQFTVVPVADGCRCVSFITRTEIAITLPRWTAPAEAPEATRKVWRQYIEALERHEAGHGAIALAAAAELGKRIQSPGATADCDELKRWIEGMCPLVIAGFRSRDQAYDEKTRHGETQGAMLPGRRVRQVR